jgi:hypothetical protein
MGDLGKRLPDSLAHLIRRVSPAPAHDAVGQCDDDPLRPYGAAVCPTILEPAKSLRPRTVDGFDFESLIFCFAIGGVAVSFYGVFTGRSLEAIKFSPTTQHIATIA